MSLPAFQHLEKKIGKQIRLFELKRNQLGRDFEKRLRVFGDKRDELAKKFTRHLREFEQKRDDDLRFIRTWFEKPLTMGAVAPSGRVLARTMARYVDPKGTGPVIELGPGTGPVTDALIKAGVDPARLVLVEFDHAFCRLLQERYPEATVVQGDAYTLRKLVGELLVTPAAAIVSGLPLMTKPLRTRLRLIGEALALLAPGAPFVQFTYAVVSPIPTRLAGVRAERSEPIWLNVPPARVWVYRRG
jgi:phosphatidylethanolamine/phosphatidyl-N-methylethanolamine N-methyltransferase